MTKANTLYDKAAANYKSALLLLENSNGDEEQLNFAGYHLQQAVELALKYLLEQNGTEYPKTHDIDQLIRIGKENGAEIYINDYIEDHAEMFTLWEAKARYVLGYAIEQKKLERALTEVDRYLTDIAEGESNQ